MKPAWDQLTEEFAGTAGVLIADVDCDGNGQSLCVKQSVSGYPTIKWGDPSEELKDYKGGRDFEGLSTFAKNNLGPPKEKTPVDKVLSEVNKVVGGLRLDINHILKFRKNGAAVVIGISFLFGLMLGRCFCPRRVTVAAGKKAA